MGQWTKRLALFLTLILLVSISSVRFSNAEACIVRSELKPENWDAEYDESEWVRVMVLLEGEPESSYGQIGSQETACHRKKLQDRQKMVLGAMADLEYTLKYEFTRLLNGFSCEMRYGDMETVAAIEGVEAVFVAGSYAPPEAENAPRQKMPASNAVTGNDLMREHGYSGGGCVIAVLDSGINLQHEAFADRAGWAARDARLTPQCVQTDGLHGQGVYISPKIPFAYDYADGDADVTDHSGHGTHVSAVAAGMACHRGSDGGWDITYSGAAPAAQILSMKIFPDSGSGTTSDVYFYALEDAYTLGADVINLSIGGRSGFTYSKTLESELFGNIYERLYDAGILVTVAGGNDGSMADFSSSQGEIGADYTDYGTVNAPATYEGNLSVASVENAVYLGTALRINGQDIPFYDTCSDGQHSWVASFGGTEQSYVKILGADGELSDGSWEDFVAAEPLGKIAVVSCHNRAPEEILQNARDTGALGCILVKPEEGIYLIPDIAYPLPAVSVQSQLIREFPLTGDVYTYGEPIYVNNPQGGQISDSSSWGTTPVLTMDPVLSSVGGVVLSASAEGESAYVVCSGTSLAAPNLAGTYVSLLTALHDLHPELSREERAELAETLLCGSASLLTDEKGVHYSPRRQGCGLTSAYNALETYQKGGWLTQPIQELGDDPAKKGVYEMSLTLHGNEERELYYRDIQAYVLYDRLATEEGRIYNTMGSDYIFCGRPGTAPAAAVSCSIDGVPVEEFRIPSGETVTVQVTITMAPEWKASVNRHFANGCFVEGYVVFREAESGAQTHASFLGYYGDWTKGSAMESADFRDVALETQAEYYTSPNMAWLTTSDRTVLGMAGENLLGDEPYDAAHIAFSTPLTNGTSRAVGISMEPYLLRNVLRLSMTVIDRETGERYMGSSVEYVPKAIYSRKDNCWESTTRFSWNGMDFSGDYVPSGTVATITFHALLPYKNKMQSAVWSFDVTVDYTAPRIEEVVYDEQTRTLRVTASDENYLQGIFLTDTQGQLLRCETFSSHEPGTSHTAVFHISDLVDEKTKVIGVGAMDYATNETKTVTFLYEGYPCFFEAFSDCEGEWYHEAVDYACACGLMNGVGKGQFAPDASLSRAMVVTVLHRQAGSPTASGASSFADVTPGIWYADAVAWAQDEGVVEGVSATEFAPDQDVTREQIAVILWRYAGSPEAEADLSAFGDAETVSDYAKAAVHWAVSCGIMNGDGRNLNPQSSATRAEFACLILRFLNGTYHCMG